MLLASSTVRESILIAAQLKLPRSMSYQQKVERVDEILRELVGDCCREAGPCPLLFHPRTGMSYSWLLLHAGAGGLPAHADWR